MKHPRCHGRALLPALVALLALWPRALPALTLVEDGVPRAVLVLPREPAPDEVRAAEEVQSHVLRITGARLDVLRGEEPPRGQAAIRIGAAAPEALLARIRERGQDPASFALVVEDRSAALRGLSPEGTLFAAYEMLEQCGVRWFFPGELGTVIPKARSLAVPAQATVQVPSFPGRWCNAGKFEAEWGRRQRMGGPFFPSSHGIDLGKAASFEAHPEYYSLVDGKRVKHQLCVSNPEVVRLAAQQVKAWFRAHPQEPWIGLGPNDGSGFCECASCRALDGGDWDPFSNERSMTDRYVWFFNQVLAGIQDEFPERKIAFYAYHTYMRPPVKTKPDPRIVPALAAIALCRVHGPDNPVCPEKSYWVWLAREWKKLLPDVYDRGYWFNLADPGFPFSEVHRLRSEVPLGRRLGLAGWRVETVHHWACETPSLYIAGRLMWNAGADVDALLRDFNEHFFGPAAGPMGRYLQLMDAALANADYHTGCSWDMPHFYPAGLREQALRLLREAGGAAGSGITAERVRLFQLSFDYVDAFIRMQAAGAAHRFADASTQLSKMDEIQKTLLAYTPPMLNPRAAPAYLKRFFRAPVEQGVQRTTSGNILLAGLADAWEFQTDPSGVGEDIGWWRPERTGGNWQTLRTSTQSWSNQGLRYYRGDAWYRQTATLPALAAGRRVFLWFAGVDEKARVWVNGQDVGTSPGSAFVPFEFDVTEAIRAGRNTVVVRVTNQRVDELGTGGICGPALFYTARE